MKMTPPGTVLPVTNLVENASFSNTPNTVNVPQATPKFAGGIFCFVLYFFLFAKSAVPLLLLLLLLDKVVKKAVCESGGIRRRKRKRGASAGFRRVVAVFIMLTTACSRSGAQHLQV